MPNYVIMFIASGNDLKDNVALILRTKSFNRSKAHYTITLTQCSQCGCGLH